jgi:hypothetical protein
MNIPEGMNFDPNDCLLLTKTIYGLVQSAREFYKKFISVLKLETVPEWGCFSISQNFLALMYAVVRELSKSMDKATMGTYLEIFQVIKLVTDTQSFGLSVQLKRKLKNWSPRVYCDSNWAGNSETRINVIGVLVYLMNVPVC